MTDAAASASDALDPVKDEAAKAADTVKTETTKVADTVKTETTKVADKAVTGTPKVADKVAADAAKVADKAGAGTSKAADKVASDATKATQAVKAQSAKAAGTVKGEAAKAADVVTAEKTPTPPRSMDEIESDLAATRERLADRIDELQDYVNPKNVAHRTLEKAKGVFVDEYGGIKPDRVAIAVGVVAALVGLSVLRRRRRRG